ncbi:hypothetical protein UO65_1022 [Actinokineospora spheciospongiae]|uniref:Uncharacterized protein n=1 Tax=Actinokineospora spheciospongiae TaxID=909613 RepID=W7IS33_9PSEU|nr:hypothetical protein UO65_1022 [Actinokineospora spheciospongiae]
MTPENAAPASARVQPGGVPSSRSSISYPNIVPTTFQALKYLDKR